MQEKSGINVYFGFIRLNEAMNQTNAIILIEPPMWHIRTTFVVHPIHLCGLTEPPSRFAENMVAWPWNLNNKVSISLRKHNDVSGKRCWPFWGNTAVFFPDCYFCFACCCRKFPMLCFTSWAFYWMSVVYGDSWILFNIFLPSLLDAFICICINLCFTILHINSLIIN